MVKKYHGRNGHRMTPARIAALKKAQRASANKRRKKKKGISKKRKVIGLSLLAAGHAAQAYGAYRVLKKK